MVGIINFRFIRRNATDTEINLHPMRNEVIKKTIYLHYPFTRELNEHVLKYVFFSGKYDYKVDEFKTINSRKQTDRELKHVKSFVKFDQNQFEEFFDLLDLEFITKLTSNFINWIETEINETEEYLKRVEKNEKDLVDLI